MESPSVTIIVLIYNDAIMGQRAIQSALAQDYPNFRVKILDNGSTDETAAMINGFASNPLVEIVTNPTNQRSEFATREALKVETDYLSFLFSDDYYAPQRLRTLMDQLKKTKAAAVFSNCEFRDQDGVLVKNVPLTQFKGNVANLNQHQHASHMVTDGNSLHPCAMLIRTQDYRDLKGFRSYLHRIGDMEFFTRLLIHRKVAFSSETLQTITLWKTGRNESYRNAIEYRPIIMERSTLLEHYRSDNFLDHLETAFPQLTGFLHPESSRNERLFWMGTIFLNLKGDDLQMFGYRCMIEAYESDPVHIEALCQERFGTTFSQYLYSVSATEISAEIWPLIIHNLKEFGRKFPLLWSLLKTLKFKLKLARQRWLQT